MIKQYLSYCISSILSLTIVSGCINYTNTNTDASVSTLTSTQKVESKHNEANVGCVDIAYPAVKTESSIDDSAVSIHAQPRVVPSNNESIPEQSCLQLETPKASIRNEQIIEYLGFTVSYNANTRLPNWVAYELTHSEVLGEVPRAKHFYQDPQVVGPQADNEDYRNSGWDKGHMCPAGDMKWSKQAMYESFYFTNICPQNPNLNRGDWKDLEEKCRELAQRYGNIYIVCGAIVGDAINGCLGYNKVTIPDAFYKVLLVKSATSYEGIGFYFDNSPGSRRLSYYAKSIDNIEELTNIDFFYQLPDDIEEKIESKFSLVSWGIN